MSSVRQDLGLQEVETVEVVKFVGHNSELFDCRLDAERSILVAKVCDILESLDVHWDGTDLDRVANAMLDDAARLSSILALYVTAVATK